MVADGHVRNFQCAQGGPMSAYSPQVTGMTDHELLEDWKSHISLPTNSVFPCIIRVLIDESLGSANDGFRSVETE